MSEERGRKGRRGPGASGPKRNPRGRLTVGRAGKPSRSTWPRPSESGETRLAKDRGRGGVLSEGLGEGRGVVGAKGLVSH